MAQIGGGTNRRTRFSRMLDLARQLGPRFPTEQRWSTTTRYSRTLRFTEQRRSLLPRGSDGVEHRFEVSGFNVRPSLAHYARADLEKNEIGSVLYFQRIFILAKNVENYANTLKRITIRKSLASLGSRLKFDVSAGLAQMLGEKKNVSQLQSNRKQSQSQTELTEDSERDELTEQIGEEEVEDEETEDSDMYDSLDDESLQAKNDIYDRISSRLESIITTCNLDSLSRDVVTGLCLFMGDYVLLIFEAAEDMMLDLLHKLTPIVPDLWSANRIVLVEDKIDFVYFKIFYFRYAPAINVNEKFAPGVVDSVPLMSAQHWILKDKLISICEELRRDEQRECEMSAPDTISELRETHLLKELHIARRHVDRGKRDQTIQLESTFAEKFSSVGPLPFSYNALLPEVQRIDLVLNCSRFYFTIETFPDNYTAVFLFPEEDAGQWPAPAPYTPGNIFERLPFDVNLTFANYDIEETKRLTDTGENEIRVSNVSTGTE